MMRRSSLPNITSNDYSTHPSSVSSTHSPIPSTSAHKTSTTNLPPYISPDHYSESNSTRRSSTVPSGMQNVFNEDDPKYLIFTIIHCRKAAIIAGLLGLFSTLIIYGVAVCYFKWYYYELDVDVIAITGFTVFLISGTFVHSLLLRAVNKSKKAFVMPFIIFHAFLLLMELIMALTSIGQLVSDQDANLDESDLLARQILLFSPICTCIQSLMLYSGVKFRYYLYMKSTLGVIRPVFMFSNVITPTLNDIKY